MTDKVVIVGAGQAGFTVAATLRKLDYSGDITLLGAEPHEPYQRPPLSKAFLTGAIGPDRLSFKPRSFYDEHGIDLRTSIDVIGVDPHARMVQTATGAFPYRHLVLATGSTPRRLPEAAGGELGRVHYLRDQRDSLSLAATLATSRRLLVVGGGYVGLEVAAVAAEAGVSVVVVEAGSRILQRVAAPETSDYFRTLHRGHGVEIREGVGLTALDGDTQVRRAVLADGSVLDVDAAVVGIGAIPVEGLARAAGLACRNGIEVDERGRTSDPNVWAAGDCSNFELDGRRVRLESVQNAVDQAEIVAANIVGHERSYRPTPWFWSDQFDVKLQIAGLNVGFDHTCVRPNQTGGGLSVWYFSESSLIAVDAINDPRSYMIGRKLLENGIPVNPTMLADTATDLRRLLVQ